MTHGNRLSQSSSLPAFHSSISFGYDAFSRMTGITNGAVSVVYTYDSLGRKVKRVKRDTTIYPDSTYYVYDGLDPVCVIRFNPASTECTTVTWLLRGLGVAPGIGNIVAQQRYTINFSGAMSQPVTHYYHPNHRGDTAYLTDASGVTAASYVYDAFGCLLTAANSALTVYRFSSKEWDPDAQLYYFGFRWYDPSTGTWTTKDPLSFAANDHNLYRFVSNQPLLCVDCYGLRLRLMYDGFIHAHLRVDTYDKQGNRTGTADLHFVPNGENGSSYKVVDMPTPFTTDAIELGSIDTTLEQDRAIYEFWQEQIETGAFHYSRLIIFPWNCWTISLLFYYGMMYGCQQQR